MKTNDLAKIKSTPQAWGLNVHVTTNGTLWTSFFADKTLMEKLSAFALEALENWGTIEATARQVAQKHEKWGTGGKDLFP